MAKKNLNLKKSMKPVSEQELEAAAGGGRPTMFGCCDRSGGTDPLRAAFAELNLQTGECSNSRRCSQ